MIQFFMSSNFQFMQRMRVQGTTLLCAALMLFALATVPRRVVAQVAPSSGGTTTAGDEGAKTRYRINLALDFDNRSYTGTERVYWTNEDDRPASVLYFHLYANVRSGVQRNASAATSTTTTPATSSSSSPTNDSLNSDEPRIEVSEVRAVNDSSTSAAQGAPLAFALDDQGTTLRVNLREPIAAGEATTIEIKFKGRVPVIEVEETGLVVHVLQQVGAALRSEREMRRARDVNFFCRGVMLLGTAYPVLAAREGDDWQRKIETSVGDIVFTEAADYEVSIDAPADVRLFASGEMSERAAEEHTAEERAHESQRTRSFIGQKMRDFAIVAGRSLRSEEKMVGDVRVRSVYAADHEATGKRVFAAAAEAVRVFTARFGELPYKTLNLVDVPLVASLGSAEFTGLGGIAGAFYIDFDSPQVRNLPEIIREQRASVEDSLEWTVAHVVAHQWWGAAVGNNPERDPVIDEALANWSALLYYREAHGEERAQAVLEDQLRGVYKVYRTFGGEDMAADRNAHDYRNFFQYSAIVASKGALMFTELQLLLGQEKFFAALKNYYRTNVFEIAEMDDLRGAFVAEAPLQRRRAVTRTFNRWLNDKRGDEDIAPPDPQLAAALGLNPNLSKGNDRGNRFARLGKFFWQQMTRIR
jgi:hypothetical protein